MDVHYSSETIEWSTPKDFFDAINQEFHFTLDVCATKENAKLPLFYTKEQNALKQVWRGRCWMNPPYGREIGKWIRKAYISSLSGTLVVCLVPARTDTIWWHKYCMRGEIRFIRGRLKFGTNGVAAPFPSVLVIFRPKKAVSNA
jgi:phage N-6-adenine-methyltransferase